ncbi:MAG: hypothetical protein RLZZ500_2671 [Bacteroidota bacterium]|jgi:proline iminopeptidase
MKKTIFTLALLFIAVNLHAQTLYSKAFGNPKDKPLLFLHGGPGYNSASFEYTTAQRLADQGFYVIVYDRRGEGRSTDPNAEFSLAEASADLQAVMEQYHLTKVTLLGHSFGGILATQFARIHPELVQSLILIGAPVSLQESFTQMIARCKTIYEAKNDLANLKYLGMLQEMDPASMMYASYCFMHAMRNGFYSTKNPTVEAKNIYASMKNQPELVKWGGQMTQEAPMGFSKNDQYTTINLTESLRQLVQKNLPIYGFYGQEDGLYSEAQIRQLEQLLPEKHLFYLPQCSHSVFIDQQTLFINTLKALL